MYGDCVPLNLFGNGNASDAAIAYVTRFPRGAADHHAAVLPARRLFDSGKTVTYTSGHGKVYNTAHQADAWATLSASGKVVEGWAGPIAARRWASYRKEQIDQIVYDPSNPDQRSGHVAGQHGGIPALRGVPTYFADAQLDDPELHRAPTCTAATT